MNIHEYQAKELLAKFGVAVPRGGVAYTAAEAVEVARRLGGPVWAVKAQIHAGGGGEGGGGEEGPSGEAGSGGGRGPLWDEKWERPNRHPGSGQLVALDAKVGFDDNALFRHPDVAALRDEDEEDPTELEAGKHALNYVKLDGNIGCMVNGAGLAMATMDIIKLYGGNPANFLDVGGGATRDRVATAFKLILSDPNVEGMLVNIFGGIMRCDVIAEGVLAPAREVNLHVPLVVRLEGTNVHPGHKCLERTGQPVLA